MEPFKFPTKNKPTADGKMDVENISPCNVVQFHVVQLLSQLQNDTL